MSDYKSAVHETHDKTNMTKQAQHHELNWVHEADVSWLAEAMVRAISLECQ